MRREEKPRPAPRYVAPRRCPESVQDHGVGDFVRDLSILQPAACVNSIEVLDDLKKLLDRGIAYHRIIGKGSPQQIGESVVGKRHASSSWHDRT